MRGSSQAGNGAMSASRGRDHLVVEDRRGERRLFEQASKNGLGSGRSVGPHRSLQIERLFDWPECSGSVQPPRANSAVTGEVLRGC